ncbi:MAG TPA: hypothetical protein VGI66_06720 [Streptosporangiaceae bacterium]
MATFGRRAGIMASFYRPVETVLQGSTWRGRRPAEQLLVAAAFADQVGAALAASHAVTQ